MKYFAKYLPVEEEIKLGDRYSSSLHGGKILQLHIDEKPWPDSKKVKLFLCSRDIKVRDEIIHSSANNTKRIFVKQEGNNYFFTPMNDDGVYGNCSVEYASKHMFKVIGEISPDATWVKEGDEFTDEQVAIRYQDGSLGILKDCHYLSGKEVLLIKGPCGHFH